MRELDERARGCERRPASPNHRTNAGKKYREKRSRPRPWRKSEKYRPSSASNPRSRGFSETRERPGARYFRARDQRSKRRGGFDSSARVGIRAIGENRNRSLDGIRSGRSAARFIIRCLLVVSSRCSLARISFRSRVRVLVPSSVGPVGSIRYSIRRVFFPPFPTPPSARPSRRRPCTSDTSRPRPPAPPASRTPPPRTRDTGRRARTEAARNSAPRPSTPRTPPPRKPPPQSPREQEEEEEEEEYSEHSEHSECSAR